MVNFLKSRPLSWSAISSWEYSPEQWYKRYILNEQEPPNAAMAFGKFVGEKLATDPTYLPQVPRLPVAEQKLCVMFGKIPLVGYMDFYDPDTHEMYEMKTGEKAWDRKRVEGHGQLDMYILMLYVTYKLMPEDIKCKLIWLPTESHGDFSVTLVEPVVPQIFKTGRTMKDILMFGARVNKVVKDMGEYVDKMVAKK